MLGTWEIIAIFLLILLIFGGKKIPEVARGLGKGLSEFKKAKNEITDSLTSESKEDDMDSKPIDISKSTEKKKSGKKQKKTENV